MSLKSNVVSVIDIDMDNIKNPSTFQDFRSFKSLPASLSTRQQEPVIYKALNLSSQHFIF